MRVVGIIGKVLIGAGIVLLLFTAYQIWGTSFQESHTQATLRSTLEKQSQNAQVKRALAEAAALDKLPTGPPVAAVGIAAPAEGNPIGEIRIPAIGINQVVVEGTNTQDLRKGPGHYIGTPLPGDPGNAAIAGHRTTYGHPFYNLNAVKACDPIVLTTVQGIFVYDMVKSQVVSPNDNAVLADIVVGQLPTPSGCRGQSSPSNAFLTLTTCNPRFSASSRLVVTAVLVHSQLFANTGLPLASTSHPQSNDLGGDNTGQLSQALFWGFVVLVVGGTVLYLAHRFRRRRWSIWGVGGVGVLVLLFFFFTAVTPLLPASY
jgi:sortase A